MKSLRTVSMILILALFVVAPLFTFAASTDHALTSVLRSVYCFFASIFGDGCAATSPEVITDDPAPALSPPAEPPPPAPPTVIEGPRTIVERIIEHTPVFTTTTTGSITEADLAAALVAFREDLEPDFDVARRSPSRSGVVLNDATIPDDLTVSNYLHLGGGTLSGALTISSGGANITGDLTIDGNTIVSNGSINVGDKIIAPGDLGIGTTTPGGKFSLQSTLADQTTFLFYGTTTQTAPLIDIYENPITGAPFLHLTALGLLGLGTTTPTSALVIDATDAIRIPVGTTAQRPGTPLQGHFRYNSENSTFEGYSGSTWTGLGGVIDVDQDTKILAELSSGSDDDTLFFYTAGSEVARFDSSGNFGIGTTTPFERLTVVDNAFIGGNLTATGTLDVQSTTGTSTFAGGLAVETSGLVYDFSSGNVGIGTTSPISSLQIGSGQVLVPDGTIAAPSLAFSTNPATGWYLGFGSRPSLASAGTNVYEYSGNHNFVGTLVATTFSIQGIPFVQLNAPNTGMNFIGRSGSNQGSGDVWIVAGTPAVTSAGSATRLRGSVGSGTDQNGGIVDINGGAPTGAGLYGNIVLASAGGNVGVGTTSPWAKLSVDGSAAFTGLANDATGYYVCLNTTTYELATSTTACGASSLRFKENVEDLGYGLTDVLSLRPVSFDWKDNHLPNGTRQIGLIAEEVAEVIPEVIGYTEDGQIANVDYPKLVALLIKAVQELATKVDTVVAGVVDIFSAREVYVRDRLCIGETCVNEAQLGDLLDLVGGPSSGGDASAPTLGSQVEEGSGELQGTDATDGEVAGTSTPNGGDSATTPEEDVPPPATDEAPPEPEADASTQSEIPLPDAEIEPEDNLPDQETDVQSLEEAA